MKTAKSLVLFAIALFIVSCNNPDHFGKVLKLNGNADIFVKDQWKPLKNSSAINYHDTIRSTDGSIEISFRNDSRLILEPNTKLIVIDSAFNNKSYIFPIIISGGILCEVHHDSTDEFSFVVYTPVSYAEAHGTHYHVTYTPVTATSTIEVFDGNVTVYNTSDFSAPVLVVPGFTTTIIGAAPPKKPGKIKFNQFRAVGYMFSPEVCEQYEVAFGFPVAPIPFPGAFIVPVPIPVPVAVTTPASEAPEPPPPPPRGRHRPHSNVNVNVSINGQLPGFSGIPVPVPGMVGMSSSATFSHHSHAPVPMPLLPPVPFVPVPMGVAPLPVPVPMVGAPVPVPVPVPFIGVPVPGGAMVSTHRSSHVSHVRPKH